VAAAAALSRRRVAPRLKQIRRRRRIDLRRAFGPRLHRLRRRCAIIAEHAAQHHRIRGLLKA